MRHLTICQTLVFRHLIAVAILSLALSVQAQPGTAQDTAQYPMPVAGTTQSVTYHNPIAYLSLDGNVYITSLDGTSSTPLTSDGYIAPKDRQYYSSVYRYGGLHWSPDGTQLSFEDTVNNKLFVVRSGKGPVQIAGAAPGSMNWLSALSPDNTHIAYFNEVNELTTISVGGGKPVTLGGFGAENKEMPDADPAEQLRANEQSLSAFNGLFAVQWTKYGILGLNLDLLKMFDTKGNILWQTKIEHDNPVLPVIAADGTRALIQQVQVKDEAAQGFLANTMVDLATGHVTPLTIPAEAQPLAWSPDGQTIFYGTQSDPLSVHDEDFSSFDFTENTLSLWQVPISGGEPALIFQRRGYAFGVVHATADGRALVFSLVTSSVDKVQAKLRHAPQVIQDKLDPAHPEIIELPLQKGAAPKWIALGGNLAIGKGNFVVPSLSLPTQQATCTEEASPRLRVGQRAKLVKAITLSTIPESAFGTYYDFMRLTTGHEVLLVGGPHCDGKGVAWMKVNYAGVVGWTLYSSDQIGVFAQ